MGSNIVMSSNMVGHIATGDKSLLANITFIRLEIEMMSDMLEDVAFLFEYFVAWLVFVCSIWLRLSSLLNVNASVVSVLKFLYTVVLLLVGIYVFHFYS